VVYIREEVFLFSEEREEEKSDGGWSGNIILQWVGRRKDSLPSVMDKKFVG
jgi:hypothetical protein